MDASASEIPEDARSLLPELRTPVPGPASRALAQRLGRVESRNVTRLSPESPIFWERANGANVWDVDGNRYLDLTAAFGVANVGHAHPAVAAAVARQSENLLHGMGDVQPTAVKVELLEALVERFPGAGEARAILGSSGSDAVEMAIKTAQLATGSRGILAFEGGYHGLSLGALDTTARSDFREPFRARLPDATLWARFGDLDHVLEIARGYSATSKSMTGDTMTSKTPTTAEIAAVLVEPVQGRGGENIPPRGFLSGLRTLCDERGWLLIADEIYTGFGRTGRWFACEHDSAVPDLLCVGKGLSSGMPISACIGRREVMDAWPPSQGEALHTQTFLGHPPGCAAALASLEVIEKRKLVERSESLGRQGLEKLQRALARHPDVVEVRGLGLMIGIECSSGRRAGEIVTAALERGVIHLPSGERGQVISITPPLSIDPPALWRALELLVDAFDEGSPGPKKRPGVAP